MKIQRTIVIRRDYLHYVRKYNRFEKRHKNPSVHLSPCFRDVSIGDIVTDGRGVPTSHQDVLKVTKAAGAKKQFQRFEDRLQKCHLVINCLNMSFVLCRLIL